MRGKLSAFPTPLAQYKKKKLKNNYFRKKSYRKIL
jgi:hypothetical protein